jgi:TetR/AcrR family transcriptional regulator
MGLRSMHRRDAAAPAQSVPAAKRARGQWRHLPSAADLRGQKIGALYRQAALAFHEKGYAGTSLADIAERLGVSKGTLYHYVGNKQEVLLGCHLAGSDAADAVLAQVPKTGLTGLQKLRLALRCHLEYILGENSASVVVLEMSALTPENFEVVAARRDRFQSGFTRLITEGIKDGSIVRCDPKLATFAVLGGANWVEKWFRCGGSWTRNQIAAAMADMMLRAVAAEPMALPGRVADYPDVSVQEDLRRHAAESTPARRRRTAEA